MPYPVGMSSRAFDAHNGRDDLRSQIMAENYVAYDVAEAVKLHAIIKRTILEVAALSFNLGWPAKGMDLESTLTVLRDCLPQPDAELLAERNERARQLVEDQQA